MANKEPAAVTAPLPSIERLPLEWEALLGSWKQPRYRATQIFRWIHQRGVVETEQMTDLPQALRIELHNTGLGACASPPFLIRLEPGTEPGIDDRFAASTAHRVAQYGAGSVRVAAVSH